MPATDEALKADVLTFRSALRENTGTALCDSGGANGRGWQQPDIPENSPMTSLELWGWDEDTGEPEDGRGEISPTLHTGAYLDENVEIDRELQAKFEEFAANRPDPMEVWEDALEAFFEEFYPGWTSAVQGNPYNEENDFSNVFTYQVMIAPDASDDWLYADEGEFVVIHRMHTGADVRGGYGRPIFSTKPVGDYCMPLEQQCRLYFRKIEREENPTPLMDGMPDTPDIAHDFFEWWNNEGRGEPGYSRYPSGQLDDLVTKCFPKTYANGEVEVEVAFEWSPGREYWDRVNCGGVPVTCRVILCSDAPYCGN